MSDISSSRGDAPLRTTRWILFSIGARVAVRVPRRSDSLSSGSIGLPDFESGGGGITSKKCVE